MIPYIPPKLDDKTPVLNIVVIVAYLLLGVFVLVGLVNSIFNLNLF